MAYFMAFGAVFRVATMCLLRQALGAVRGDRTEIGQDAALLRHLSGLQGRGELYPQG